MSTSRQSGMVESSAVVTALRTAVRAIARGAANTIASAKETNRRLAVGLRREPRRPAASSAELEALVKDSRIMRALMTIAGVPITAWQHSRVKAWLDAILAIDLQARIRLAGVALLSAVITHILVIAAIGVHTFASGWATRVIAALAALALMAWPGAFAAAWKDRRSR